VNTPTVKRSDKQSISKMSQVDKILTQKKAELILSAKQTKKLNRDLIKKDYDLRLIPIIEALAMRNFTVEMLLSFFDEKRITTYYGTPYGKENFRKLMQRLSINYSDLKPKISKFKEENGEYRKSSPLDYEKGEKLGEVIEEAINEVNEYE